MGGVSTGSEKASSTVRLSKKVSEEANRLTAPPVHVKVSIIYIINYLQVTVELVVLPCTLVIIVFAFK